MDVIAYYRVSKIKSNPIVNSQSHLPLVIAVDLDGTLLKTDSLHESAISLIHNNPLNIFVLPLWLAGGKASIYVYGSAKAMVTTFTSGLRQRLHKSNVTVVTIKPGFVDTPMTASFKKGLLWAKSDTTAAKIVQAIDKRKDEVCVPAFWVAVMTVIIRIPSAFFKNLKL